MRLPAFSLKNPVLAQLMLWGIVLFGAVAALSMRRELFPNTTPNAIRVSAEFPGASPVEVETLVILPLEEVLQRVLGVETMRSEAQESFASIHLTLERGEDPADVLREVDAELENVNGLPDAVLREGVKSRYIAPRLPIISVSLFGDAGLDALRRAAERLEDDLLRDSLTSQTEVLGIPEREVSIELDPRRLEELGLLPLDVARIISADNRDEPAGIIRSQTGETLVRNLGRRERLEDLAELAVVSTAAGGVVQLGDIAEINVVWVEPRVTGRFNGQPAARVVVYDSGKRDVIALAARVREIVAAQPQSEAVQFEIHGDLSRYVNERIELMTRNGIYGLGLVFVCLALFLSLRLSFWVSVGIPVSFLGTLIVMSLAGLTLNLISLFGLIVVLGMIVDDAIVIGENTFRHFENGVPAREAALRGASEVAWPVTAAVLTSIAAFLPMMMIEGRFGEVIRPLPLVVSVALLVSLVEALVLLPAHLAGSLEHKRPGRQAKNWLHARLDGLSNLVLRHLFGPLLRRLLRFRYLTVTALFCAALFSVVVAVYLIPFHLSSETEAEALFCQLELPVGEPLARTEATVRAVEQLCREQVPECLHIFSLAGVKIRPNSIASAASVTRGTQYGQVFIELRSAESRARSSSAILTQLRELTAGIPELKNAVWDATTGSPTGPDVEIEVRGAEPQLSRDVLRLKGFLQSHDGVHGVKTDDAPGKAELRLSLLPYGRAVGLTVQSLSEQTRGAIHGLVASTFYEAHGQIDIVVRYVGSSLESVGQLEKLYIFTPSGAQVPLSSVARVSQTRGQGVLNRVDRKRAVTCFASVDRKRTTSVKVVESVLAAVELRGIDLRIRGEQYETQKSMGSLGIVVLLACALIYAILAAVFKSYLQPVIVMAAIPLALIGIVIGHLVLDMEISLMSLTGVVALCGIVVNDSLILVDFINETRGTGRSLIDDVVLAAATRVRPILLTSLTTIAGLAPLMLESSFQARFIIPMAMSLSFGLAFATVLTLFAIPCLYLVVEDIKTLQGVGPELEPEVDAEPAEPPLRSAAARAVFEESAPALEVAPEAAVSLQALAGAASASTSEESQEAAAAFALPERPESLSAPLQEPVSPHSSQEPWDKPVTRKQRMVCPGCGAKVRFSAHRQGSRVRHTCGKKFYLRVSGAAG